MQTGSRTFRIVLGIVIAAAIVLVVLVAASTALWTGGFTVGQ